MAFYPVTGLVIGGLSGLGFYLLSLIFAKPLALWLTIGVLALLTGGLHLDGFADTIDGLACRGTKEKILEVMRDSRVGAFGVMGLILLIGAKYLGLSQFTSQAIPYTIALMTAMGKGSIVLVCYRSAYARLTGGLAKPFAENLSLREVTVSLVTALGIAIALAGIRGAAVFIGTVLFSLGCRFFFIKKLGGVTGDILGAANELAELLSLLLVLALPPLSVF